jgi:hypothetical protein
MAVVLLCLTPGWLYALDESCEIQGIRMVSSTPDTARFEVAYFIPPGFTNPCFIGAYVPDISTAATGFSYAPAGALPQGVPKGARSFNAETSFAVRFMGPNAIRTGTIEVILFEKDKILCSRTFALDKTWEAHGSSLSDVILKRGLLTETIVEREAHDRDRDGLIDEMEGNLADACRPYARFDSDESAREEYEPVTLFQVRPLDLRTAENLRVEILWAFLYRQDIGYGQGSWCTGGHAGDIATARYELSSQDGGTTWTITLIRLGRKESLTWSPGTTLETYGAHPVLFISAGNHNPYFSISVDGRDSLYSSWGCNENVNGRGALVMPDLKSVWGDVFNNVGEPEFHPGPPFINSLDRFYAGQSVWQDKKFYSQKAGRINRLWLSVPWQGGIPRGYRLRSFGHADRFIRHRRFLGELTRLNSSIEKQAATFLIVPGLADAKRISFEAIDRPGYFLCTRDFRIELAKPADEAARRDATFKKVHGLAEKSCSSFESLNHPGYFIRQRDFHIVLEKGKDEQFRWDATFCIMDPE